MESHGNRRGKGQGPSGPGPMAAQAQVKDAKGTFKRLLSLLKPFRVPLILVICAVVLATVLNVISPTVMGLITTELFKGFTSLRAGGPGVDFDQVRRLLVILALLYLAYSGAAYMQQFIMAKLVQDVVYDLRESAKSKLDRLPLSFFDRQPKGEILSRIVNDVDVISSTLQDTMVQAMSAVVTLVGVVVMMLSISPLMTLLALVTVPLSLFVTLVIAKRAQGFFAVQQASLGEMNSHIEEMYGGHTVIKAFSQEKASIEEFAKRNEAYYQAAWKAGFVSGVIRPLMGFIGNLGYVAVCVLGAYLAIQGRVQVGQIQAFIQYMREFSRPITQLGSVSGVIQQTLASAERIFEILDQEELEDESGKQGACPQVLKGAVEFDHVRFGYLPDQVVIKDLCVKVEPGQTVAIVGPTGAGKTTLVNLLMRFYEVGEGAILVDGRDIRSFSREELRSHFGMVLQDTWLFSGTIRENIRYGKPDATDEEVEQAARLSHADHFIRTLPAGYDTLINEEADNISVGQKQLITIARAILISPEILILDEATSSIDTRTERLVQQAMTEVSQGRTSFVIAHRLSTIRNADLILVIREGDIVEQGSHEELLALDGFYAELYNSQFVDCIDELDDQP